jgi:hypothetical protein
MIRFGRMPTLSRRCAASGDCDMRDGVDDAHGEGFSDVGVIIFPVGVERLKRYKRVAQVA